VGRTRLAVAVVDDDGAYDEDRESVTVVKPAVAKRGKAQGKRSAAPAPAQAPRARAATLPKRGSENGGDRESRSKPAAEAPPTVRAAQTSPSVRIEDFKYVPASVSVEVGTTVTWTNEDSTAHTATAEDGTFDTGMLAKGASGSFTFDKAGTYDYYCIPHKFMKASITVTGAGDSGSGTPEDEADGDTGGTGGSGGGGGGDDSGGDSNLPHTGLQVASVVLCGLLLLGAGVAVRRRVRPD
jgi:plastocyanin